MRAEEKLLCQQPLGDGSLLALCALRFSGYSSPLPSFPLLFVPGLFRRRHPRRRFANR